MTSARTSLLRGMSLLAVLALAIAVFAAPSAWTQEVSIKILVNDDPISDYDISQRERFLAGPAAFIAG